MLENNFQDWQKVYNIIARTFECVCVCVFEFSRLYVWIHTQNCVVLISSYYPKYNNYMQNYSIWMSRLTRLLPSEFCVKFSNTNRHSWKLLQSFTNEQKPFISTQVIKTVATQNPFSRSRQNLKFLNRNPSSPKCRL